MPQKRSSSDTISSVFRHCHRACNFVQRNLTFRNFRRFYQGFFTFLTHVDELIYYFIAFYHLETLKTLKNILNYALEFSYNFYWHGNAIQKGAYKFTKQVARLLKLRAEKVSKLSQSVFQLARCRCRSNIEKSTLDFPLF